MTHEDGFDDIGHVSQIICELADHCSSVIKLLFRGLDVFSELFVIRHQSLPFS